MYSWGQGPAMNLPYKLDKDTTVLPQIGYNQPDLIHKLLWKINIAEITESPDNTALNSAITVFLE